MSLSGYATYRQSPVEWLGEIPTGWTESKLKFFASSTPGGTPDTENQDYWSDSSDGLPWVAIGDMSRRDELWSTAKSVSDAGRKSKGLRIGSPGTILFAMYASVGEVCTLRVPAVWNQALLGLQADERFCTERFLFYSLLTVKDRLPFLYRSNTQNNLNADQVMNLAFALPGVGEQEIITGFLDRETAKIDALIAKQEQLIATLREDRTATITHAITKGIDPNAEMKDSGVEWIGSVPAHWTVPQIGMNARIGNGSTPAREELRYWSGGTVPWLNSSHVNNEEITEADQFVTDAAYRECHLPMVAPGSVLVGLTGQGKTRGMASVLLKHATINQHLAYITPTSGQLQGRFLQRVLTSAYGFLRELSDENGSTKGGLTCGTLRKVRIPLPPPSEQQAIADDLQKKCGDIDALVAKANAITDTLREYRSALITDAVTGKIDARGAA